MNGDESATLVAPDSGLAGGSNESTAATTTSNHPSATVTMPAAPVPGQQQHQLQQRRKQFFFRTLSSIGTDPGGSWGATGGGGGGGGGSNSSPRFSSLGDLGGYGPGGKQLLRRLAWALLVNAALALLLLGAVEALVLPVLIASLELTPSPRACQLLTAMLTAHLFQAGARGTLLLLLAVGGAALGLALTGAWDRGFVPLFLAWYVGLDTLARVATGLGGAGALPSSSSSSMGGGGGGGGVLVGEPLKTLSETSSARWSPVGRWRFLWGA